VVRSGLQQDAIDRINGELAPGRFHFVYQGGGCGYSAGTHCALSPFIYHFEQCWYAAWLPQRGEDYLYGYAYAFKNTSAAAKQVPNSIWNSKEQCTEHTIGRGAQIFTYSRTVTKQDIINGKDGRNWRAMGIASYYQKARDINEAINSFESALMETIPTWSDCRSMFDRLRCNNIVDALDMPAFFSKPIADKTKYQLTVDNLLETSRLLKNGYGYSSYGSNLISIESIVATPFIKKQLQLMLDRSYTGIYQPREYTTQSYQVRLQGI
jgi:hypothetical protein